MRWLISLAVTAGMLLAGDAAVRSYVESTAAASLEKELGRGSSADVSLGGFPFVVRLVSGSLPAAELRATDVKRAGLRIGRLTVEAEDLHGSFLGDGGVRVGKGRGVAMIDLGILGRFIERRAEVVSVEISGDAVTVRVPSIDRAFRVPVGLEDGRLVIQLPRIDDIVIRLPRLLDGVDYEEIRIVGDRAELSFRLSDIALPSR